VNLGDRIQWISEDTVELHIGKPVANDTLVRVEKISQWIHLTQPEWLVDYCYGFGVFSLVVRPERIDVPILVDELSDIMNRPASDIDFSDARVIEIPVCYSPEFGLDLQLISETINLSVDRIIDLHCGRDYRVLATGFVPGFAYLGETDHAIHLPRRDTPRTRIPAGSVAIAENQTVVYPRETPGGWHIIGRMPGSIVSLSKDAINAKLEMGRLVRFKSISMDDFLTIEAADDPG
jgi:inhibitor of KinA